jgi:hypothetical protein
MQKIQTKKNMSVYLTIFLVLQPSMMVHAVLQQEVMLYCGKLMGAHPHLFKGILNIRVAWVALRAVRLSKIHLMVYKLFPFNLFPLNYLCCILFFESRA